MADFTLAWNAVKLWLDVVSVVAPAACFACRRSDRYSGARPGQPSSLSVCLRIRYQWSLVSHCHSDSGGCNGSRSRRSITSRRSKVEWSANVPSESLLPLMFEYAGSFAAKNCRPAGSLHHEFSALYD